MPHHVSQASCPASAMTRTGKIRIFAGVSLPLHTLVIGVVIAAALAVPLASIGTLGIAFSETHSHVTQPTMPDTSHLPISFEPNMGQTDAHAQFLARGDGYTLFLTSSEAVISLAAPRSTYQSSPSRLTTLRTWQDATADRSSSSDILHMRWEGANPSAAEYGEQVLPGVAKYYLGSDPARWLTHVPTYAQVRETNLYPGVDLVYYGTQGQLEYDYVVNPGADPRQIVVSVDGATSVLLNPQGDLVMELLSGRSMTMQAPYIYQDVNGVRHSIAGSYALRDTHRVAFHLGDYDHHLPLVIDPVVRYQTYFGGSADDAGNAVAIDPSGNIWLAGSTFSRDFPGAPKFSDNIPGDAFLTKLNPSGTAVLFTITMGSPDQLIDIGATVATGVAVDAAGNVYATGWTESTYFYTQNALQSTLNGGEDAWIAKFDAQANGVYSTYFGGSANDEGFGIAVDGAGNAYIAGDTNSTNLPTANAAQSSNAGLHDAFVAKVSANGQSIAYSTYLGGSDHDKALAIALDGTNSVYVTGWTFSANFPTKNAVQPTHNVCTCYDAFVSKLSATGALAYSTYLGGGSDDFGQGIAVDGGGAAYVTGYTNSSDFPLLHPIQGTFLSGFPNYHAFVNKLGPTGSVFAYSTYLEGTGTDEGSAIAVDTAGQAYVTGYTTSTDFPHVGALQSSYGGGQDAFVTAINPAGSAYTYSSYLGGSGLDNGNGLAVGRGGLLYVIGATASTNFPTDNAYQSTGGQSGYADAFVAKLVFRSVQQAIGEYNPANAVYYLRNSNSGGNANIQFAYGPAGCVPLSGDWTGKGYDSIGAYCPNSATFYLRNSNSGGNADIAFRFGPANCAPLVGDWTGKGFDSVGVDCAGTFYLRNANSGGGADFAFVFGPITGCTPLAGDWTGKGYDSIGLDCAGTFYLRNSNSAGNADTAFTYGPSSGCAPDTGDWTGKGFDSVGIYCGNAFYLRNSNSGGNADIAFVFGATGFAPLAGTWVAG